MGRKQIATAMFALGTFGSTFPSAAVVYECSFPRTGIVTINPDYPGTSITVDGETMPAASGSYFYQTDDGQIAIAFRPGMEVWEILPDGETSTICEVRR